MELYRSFRVDEMAPVPWSPEQKHAFLEQQFLLQHRHYTAVFPEAEFLVIEIGGRPVGRLYLDNKQENWLIVDIGLLPEWRRQGRGSVLISAIQDQAKASGAAAISLHVEQRNFRAQALYTRLGFRVTNDAGTHIHMEWDASRPSQARLA